MGRGRLSTWKLSILQTVSRQLQGRSHCTFAVPVLKQRAWQAAAPVLPLAASLAPQRAQGALVMSSVKSHTGCAGKCEEEQQGPASLFCLQGKSGLAE